MVEYTWVEDCIPPYSFSTSNSFLSNFFFFFFLFFSHFSLFALAILASDALPIQVPSLLSLSANECLLKECQPTSQTHPYEKVPAPGSST